MSDFDSLPLTSSETFTPIRSETPLTDPFDSDSSLSDISDAHGEDDDLDDGRPVTASINGNTNGNGNAMSQDFLDDNESNESDELDDDDDDDDEDFEETEARKGKSKSKKGAATSKKSSAARAGNAKPAPYDSIVIPMGDKSSIEKLISWRTTDDGSEEILVKYKNLSYCHAEWLPRAEVEGSKMGKMRVKRFMEKPSWEMQWSEDEPFNPSFLKIDRLLDEGELGDKVFYLVKWCAQTYDASTWENAEKVKELDADKITEFARRRHLDSAKEASYLAPRKRPNPKEWKKLDESPSYKNDMQLRPYQLEGLNWLLFCWYNRQNSILADEMGLGKTVQSTVFLDYLYTKERFCGPFLIVTPLSTIGNWEREIKTWTELNVVVYHGRDISRKLIEETEFYYRDSQGHIIPDIYKFDIILTTYEMAMAGASHLRPIAWRCVVLDEAHRLKNKTSKVSEILKTYRMDHRVLLTGTPLQNSLDELWALLNFLQPDRFGSESDFQREYGSLSSAADVEKLQGLLKPLMLRRMKEDVEKSLPVKEETIIEVELTTTQKKWYRSILEKNFTWLKQGTKKTNVPNLINTMIELRKCCIHPFLLKGAEDQIMRERGGDTVEHHFQALVQASGKMVLIDKLLTKLKAGGHKVLIFSQMTRCLDLIQDYLRGRQWHFERIDGGVRGDLRQAAIDRFSAPDSDTFIFLLCTRAGGVGINLTAADTCIIFDSDWNPQNDLQAQSRVHRIGQKRPVQIYRLITRNTYEREMFDRASMKLGLDRAILQRMDAQSLGESGLDGLDTSKPPSSLSKTEIEELLKKGAYGAMLDDDASNQFCDEDIDSILSRRTHVIKHDTTTQSEKGSIFSKATFSASNADNVDVNDPDFWDKMAERAKLEVVEITPEADLILDLPRQRRQVQRFGAVSRGSPFEDEDDGSRGSRSDTVKPWALAEKTRLERAMMVHGFSGWQKMVEEALPRRAVEDVKACARAMVIHGLKVTSYSEAELINDVKAALAQETGDILDDTNYVIPEIPYEGATRRQIAEYRSFLLDAPPEYHEHLEKRAKNMLSRIAMMFCIREKIKPTKDMKMPRVVGAPPAPWWGLVQDRDLIIGISKYGYQQYDRIRMDPELCFFSQTFADLPAADTNGDVELGIDRKDDKDNVDPDDVDDVVDENGRFPAADTPGSENASGTATPSFDATEQAGNNGLHFPSPSDLGFRLRRIMAAFQKELNSAAREEAKRQQAEERTRLRQEKEQEKIRAREHDLTRKERQEFLRTLMSFGVETLPGSPGVRDWKRFKELSNLRKSPEVLEDHFIKLMAICDDVIRCTELAAMQNGTNGLSLGDAEEALEASIREKDPDITYDKAKKLLKRLDQMRILREQVLPHPQLDDRLAILKRHGRSGLPSWWSSEYDKHFLLGIAKWGLNRSDLIMEDPTSAFFPLHQEFLQSLEVRRAENISRDELVDGKWEEKFWMREPVALRRFEALLEAALKEPPPKSQKKHGRRSKASSPDRMYDDLMQSPKDYSGKSVRLKLKVGYSPYMDDDIPPEETPSQKRKRTASREDSGGRKRAKGRVKEEDDLSGDDTDEMLQAARKRTDKKKKKRREVEEFDAPEMEGEEYDVAWESPRPHKSHRSTPTGSDRKRKKHRKSERHSLTFGEYEGAHVKSDAEDSMDDTRKRHRRSKHDKSEKRKKHRHKSSTHPELETEELSERHSRKRSKSHNDYPTDAAVDPMETSQRSRYSIDYLEQHAVTTGPADVEQFGDPIFDSDAGEDL
ncbi:uncharacterized protein SPPG_07808 [Spizellomyces punctatus DAOM BR117]|uniref:Chromodomain-helicase-DNA-binding protein 6 n=1 Tax=Spizellomyces punctatus (strain DAOM BR117) TaxID=645134 RepID=A0A0L0H7U2_SPIPD|nr:uncharacterized protein SPPG_07808 [Spizellomyces punctatus DAOM BR117]KNC96991.1 hypothetical protein SPPG_07808 [Spizellomyces punctatus DAOM BR117]|eukprot:XP_016605031.1 hypothetical protein SPPG_07808 [Spizellomyces punctatus DAOM BR117]